MRYFIVCLLVTMVFAYGVVTSAHARAGQEAGEEAVLLAKQQLGVKYVFGAESPGRAFDCSGLIKWVFGKLGIALPHYARSQQDRGKPASRHGLKPGDLVFFNDGGHVGLYMGDNKFIHASSGYGEVTISSLDQSWYERMWDGARRLLLSGKTR